MKKLIAGLLASLMLMSTAAKAQGPDDLELRPYLDLGLQYVPTDHDERVSGYGDGLFAGGGVPLNRYFTVEGDMYYDKWKRDSAPNDNKWKEYGAEAQGLLTLPIGSGWIPFLSAGVGVTKSRISGNGSSTDLQYSLGSGVFYLFNAYGRDWGLRFDARYRRTDIGDGLFGDGNITGVKLDDKIGEAVVRFGVMMLLGHRAEPVVAVASDPDSDGDGVPDSRDKCPGTPKGTKVDADGCPLAANVGGPAKPLKSLGPIYFDFDKSDLKASERAKLDNAIKIIAGMKKPKIIIKLDGNTDDVGTPEYNTGLGERRALVVKKYLVGKGVKDQIEVTSYGESKPAADNATEQGRALNRRVEVLVVDE